VALRSLRLRRVREAKYELVADSLGAGWAREESDAASVSSGHVQYGKSQLLRRRWDRAGALPTETGWEKVTGAVAASDPHCRGAAYGDCFQAVAASSVAAERLLLTCP